MAAAAQHSFAVEYNKPVPQSFYFCRMMKPCGALLRLLTEYSRADVPPARRAQGASRSLASPMVGTHGGCGSVGEDEAL